MYSRIERAIIRWGLDEKRTAEELKKEIIKIIKNEKEEDINASGLHSKNGFWECIKKYCKRIKEKLWRRTISTHSSN